MVGLPLSGLGHLWEGGSLDHPGKLPEELTHPGPLAGREAPPDLVDPGSAEALRSKGELCPDPAAVITAIAPGPASAPRVDGDRLAAKEATPGPGRAEEVVFVAVNVRQGSGF